MTGLVDGAIGRARMVLAIMICALIAGVATYIALPKESDPDVAVPILSIFVPLEGVSPEDAERLLVRPVEQELESLETLTDYQGIALEGGGLIIAEFEISFDVDQALIDVRERVDMARRFFPAETREPVIEEFNAALFPIMVVNVFGDAPQRGMDRLTRELQDELEALDGVLEATLRGGQDEFLEIVVDPIKLDTYNISFLEIAQAVTANNQLVPAGSVDTGEGRFSVKVPGLIKSAEDALSLPIRTDGDAAITVADVATVRRTYKDRTSYARYNGRDSLSLEVVKRPGANILDTAKEVRLIAEEHKRRWPTSIDYEINSDVSIVIDQQLKQLQGSILIAVVLVMIVCIAALGIRSALLVGLAIPTSFMLASLLLGTFGYTINMMVMFGMIIAVGILVDGAIVVVEYADRKMAEGMDRKSAYAMAGKRMFWPVVASSATTLAAFFPFLFWDTLIGKFMSYLPITLIFVLVSSLVMALIFLPVIGSVVGARPQGVDEKLAALSGADGRPEEVGGWLGSYVRLTRILIARPLMVTGLAASVVALIFMVFVNSGSNRKSELFLDIEPDQIYVLVMAQGSLSAAEEYAIVSRAENALLRAEGVKAYTLRSGNASGGEVTLPTDGVGNTPSDTIGQILVDLKANDGVNDGRESMEAVRAAMEAVPGLRYEIRQREQGPPASKDIDMVIGSNNEDDRLATTLRVRQFLESMDGLKDIEDTLPLPGIEYRLEIDRTQAGKFGVDVGQVGAAVQLLTNGVLVGRYRPDDANDELDIRVRLPEEERSIEAIDRMNIATTSGPVPLSQFVKRTPAQRVTQIERKNGKRITYLRANATEVGAGPIRLNEVKDWLETQEFPPSVEITFAGSFADTEETNAFFEKAGLAALFLMGVILLWEFNNFWQVFLTLSAVIISTAGVLIGIMTVLPYVSTMMIGTGIVALAGIVVNNNIVLIDTFNRLREDGRTTEEAALAAAAQRIRPILLTTFTTICGLLPMVFLMNFDFATGVVTVGGSTAEWWVQLATAVVFGLGFSTIMILLVTPVWLCAPEKIGKWRRRMIAHLNSSGSPAPASSFSLANDEARKPDIRPAAE